MDNKNLKKLLKYKLPLFILSGSLLVMVALKVWLLIKEVIPFNADEAIVGLMARHILQGERPVFFYGQVYMGSLDAFLVAGGFAFLGQEVWVIRFIQILLYLAIIITTVMIGKVAFQSIESGLLAAILLAVPNINTTLYTTISLGGYGEALLLGNLMILLGVFMVKNAGWLLGQEGEKRSDIQLLLSERGWMLSCLLGAGMGFGLWVNGLTLVYSLPVFLLVFYGFFRTRVKATGMLFFKHFSFGLLGFFLGAAPWWVYSLQYGGGKLIFELFGSAVSVESAPFFQRLVSHFFNLVVLGGTVILGIRPPWEIRWLAMPLLPFNLFFWFGVLFFWAKQMMNKKMPYILMGGIGLVLSAGFLFTSFGVDPSGRYFLPLAVPLSLIAGEMVRKVSTRLRGSPVLWQAIAVGLIVLYNFWGTMECANRYPPGINSQFDLATVFDRRYDEALIRFLKSNDLKYGYTNYWVAYPLAFLSQESLVYAPKLPYHDDLRYTSRDDRYAPYAEAVRSASSVAYITTKTPKLDTYLEQAFASAGIGWQETWIGDYHIYHDLIGIIHPEEMGLGGIIQ